MQREESERRDLESKKVLAKGNDTVTKAEAKSIQIQSLDPKIKTEETRLEAERQLFQDQHKEVESEDIKCHNELRNYMLELLGVTEEKKMDSNQ